MIGSLYIIRFMKKRLFSWAGVSNNTIILRPSTQKVHFWFAAVSDVFRDSLSLSLFFSLAHGQSESQKFKKLLCLLLLCSQLFCHLRTLCDVSQLCYRGIHKKHMERITEIQLPLLSCCVAGMNVEVSLMVTEPYRISEASTGFWFGVGLINLRFQERLHVFFFILFACAIYLCIYMSFLIRVPKSCRVFTMYFFPTSSVLNSESLTTV